MTERKGPTVAQLKALRLALPSGGLRRLPGGYWVGHETQWRGNEGLVKCPAAQWVGTVTIEACVVRGWMAHVANGVQMTKLGTIELRNAHDDGKPLGGSNG